MDRKYLLLKEDYSYFDYMDFMDIQESMLIFYAETAQMLGFFNEIFRIFAFLLKSNSTYSDYIDFDQKLVLSNSVFNMHLGIARLYFRVFSYQNFYFRNFVKILLAFQHIMSFSSYLFIYMFSYF